MSEHNLVQVPMRHLECRNKENGSGIILHLELTDEDIKNMQDTLSYIGIEIKEQEG